MPIKDVLDDIDCMINTLCLAKRELGYAVVYESERNILNEDQWIGFIKDHQQPSGTIIREGLKHTPKSSVPQTVRTATLRATAISSVGVSVIWWNWLRPMFTMPNTSSGASPICPSCRKSGSTLCLRPPKSSLAS